MPALPDNPFGQEETFSIRTYDIDAKKRITVPALVRLMQEAAMQNIIRLGLSVWDLEKDDQSWVLLRKHLHIDRLPILGEKLRIVTSPTGYQGLFTYRDYFVYDEAGKPLAQSSTRWMLMSMINRRPIRLPKYMQELVDTADVESHLSRPDRDALDKPGEAASVNLFKVRFHDLDFNLHLNNTYYIQWMLDSLPLDLLANGQLQNLDIQYLHEARHGERISSLTEKVGTHTYLHQLVREEDQKELARAKTVWRSGGLSTSL